MEDMKCLVVYYSRTGYTQKVAEAVAGALHCEVAAVAEKKSRRGPLGFMGAVKDAVLKKASGIEESGYDLSDYALVIIGTPVWANSVSPAIRSLLDRAEKPMPEAAFFLTTGRSGIENTFNQMSELCGREPVAKLALRDRKIKKGAWEDEVAEFVDGIRRNFTENRQGDCD